MKKVLFVVALLSSGMVLCNAMMSQRMDAQRIGAEGRLGRRMPAASYQRENPVVNGADEDEMTSQRNKLVTHENDEVTGEELAECKEHGN